MSSVLVQADQPMTRQRARFSDDPTQRSFLSPVDQVHVFLLPMGMGVMYTKTIPVDIQYHDSVEFVKLITCIPVDAQHHDSVEFVKLTTCIPIDIQYHDSCELV